MAVVGSVTLETKLDTKSFDKQIAEVEEQIKNIQYDLEHPNELNLDTRTIKTYELELEKLNNKLVDLKKKKEDANKIKLDDKGFGGLDNVIKKITKIGLGLIGLRTGMALLRSSIRTVADQNDEISTKINTIKSAIANGLTPVVQWVINLFSKLLAYANYILGKWFGINLFAKNTANNTKKIKNNLGGANKEATKLKRTLAGFDEMNILQKDGGVSTGGGGGGISTDDIDMSMFDNIEIPKWVKWLADNKDSILGTLKEIAIWMGTAFAINKLLEFIPKIGLLKEAFSLLLEKLKGFAVLAAITTAFYGFIGLIRDLISGSESASSVLKNLALAIGGVSAALLILNASNPLGWIGLAISAVMAYTSKQKSNEIQLLSTKKAQEQLTDATRKYKEGLNTLLSAQKEAEESENELIKVGKEHGWTLEETVWQGNHLIDMLLNQEKEYKDLTPQEKQLVDVTSRYSDAQRALGDELKANKERIDEMVMAEVTEQKALAAGTKNYDAYQAALKKAWERGLIDTLTFAKEMEVAFYAIDEAGRQVFYDNLPTAVQDMLKEINWRIEKNKFPGLNIYANVDTSKANKTLNALKQKWPLLFSGFSKGGIAYFKKGGIMNVPRLAPGGVINRPGAGVPLAVGGEHGAEAVVPLTDSQQMDLLGRTIASYVNIRAEVPVYVGNRQIAREIRNINADESFAYNG